MEWPLQGDISMWQMLLPRVLLQIEFWGVKQNLIPYVWQMELAYISVKGWNIDPYKTRNKNKNLTRDNSNSLNQKPYTVVPYYKGMSESLKKICGKHGVQVYFKGGHTIKSLLMNPQG